MNTHARTNLTRIQVAAGLAALTFVGVAGWSLYTSLTQPSPSEDTLAFTRSPSQNATVLSSTGDAWRRELEEMGIISTSTGEYYATSSDPLTYIDDILAEQVLGNYIALKDGDIFSPERARSAGEEIGKNILPASTFTPYTTKGLTTTSDTSRERMLRYRSDMREALAPLITSSDPEFAIFAQYLETKNPERLVELNAAAARYHKAEQNMLAVAVPEDALEMHLRGVNALGAYANTIERLVLFANAPLATLALLRTYNEVEREMLYAFDALSDYYVRKAVE